MLSGEERMLRACRRQPVDCTPVWFMRQAGRCIAEYRQLRQQYDILTICQTPELSTQVTLMPVEQFQVDAAVIFADIMLPLAGMGIDFEFQEGVGPVIHNPVRSATDVAALRVIEPEDDVPYVLEAIRLIRRELAGKTALIGFSGAPFTLACYMIEGRPSRDYALAKGLMFSQPDLWHALLHKLSTVVLRYLKAQIRAGAQVVQLFDSWVGALSPPDYRQFVLPHSQRIFAGLADREVPRIHFGTGAASLLELLAEAGPDVMSVDWRVPLDQAWERIGANLGIQGNLDPTRLLAPFERVEEGMQDVLRRANRRPGHIFNLGHGVLPATPPEYLAQLVAAVHEATRDT